MKQKKLIAWIVSISIHAMVFAALGLFVQPAGKKDGEKDFMPVELFEIESKTVRVEKKESRTTAKKPEREVPRKRIEKKVAKPVTPEPVKKTTKPVQKPIKEPQLKAPLKVAETGKQAPSTKPLKEERPAEPQTAEALDTSPAPQQGVLLDEELARFKRLVREKIERAKFYPVVARKRGYEGAVGVAFRILEDGRVDDIRVTSPCKCEALNMAACEVIKRASPFPPPPETLRAEGLDMEVNIIFKLD